MFKVLIFMFAFAVYVTTSLAYDFEKEFTRLINENSDSEQQLYEVTANTNEEHTLSFPQKLDHFKSANKVTWEQRSIILNTHYRKQGPFFLYLFGNEEASVNWLRNSRIMSYAKDHNALVIGLEHRFYGDSRPFTNTSLENLNYLNIEQALADIANFIETVNHISLVPSNTKWILFGGFYGGSLAAWARMKYPHLIHGAVASSALISIKSDFPEYLQSVKNSYSSYNSSCAKNIQLAFQQLNQAFQTEEGRKKISELFKLCSSLINNEDDMAIVKGTLIAEVSEAVEKNHNADFSISTVCDIMNQQSTSAMENLGSVNRKYLSPDNLRCWYTKKQHHISVYQEDRYENRDQSLRLWFYQSCTQIGLDLISTKSVDMFGEYNPDTESNARYCQDVFGPEFNQQTIDDGVREINIAFGGLAFNTNQVVFVQGSINPWKLAGVSEKAENALYDVISIEGASHLADLETSHRNDDLENGIRKIKDLLKSWLA